MREGSAAEAGIGLASRSSACRARRTERATTPAKPTLDAEMSQWHPLRILPAEDNLANQRPALRQLSQIGYRADVATNAMEAIERIEWRSDDVALMDMQRPGMEGLQAMQSPARGS